MMTQDENKSPPGIIWRRTADLAWNDLNIAGTPLAGAPVYASDLGVRSSFYRMAAGDMLKKHRHMKWVQVMVVEGAMEVTQDGEEPFVARAGELYFVQPRHPHTEKAIEPSLILITTAEPPPPPAKKRP